MSYLHNNSAVSSVILPSYLQLVVSEVPHALAMVPSSASLRGRVDNLVDFKNADIDLPDNSDITNFRSPFDLMQCLPLVSQCLVVLVVVFAAVYTALHAVTRPQNLPPGPRGYPVLGVIPRLGKKPYLTIQRWWETYGDVFSMYMGSRLVVVLNGVEVMRECLVKQGDVFSNRPWNYFKKLAQNCGIVFTDGEPWREHRRFTLSCLRDFGMGKVCLEAKIHEEASYLLQRIADEDGRPFDMRTHVPQAVSNMICSIIYGSRFEYDDPVFRANVDALDQSVRNQSMLGKIQFLPFLEVLPKILPLDKILAENVRKRDEYASLQIQRHRATLDPSDPRDFIDAYFAKMESKKASGERTTFEERQLKRTIQDLFIAGSETLTTTLKWAILYMCVFPEVQRRVQAEIDHEIGRARMPTMKDKPTMPYTEATLMECQRLGNIALFSVPRCTTQDTEVNGYTIPKGTWIFVNRWGSHMSTRYWKNPKQFNPSRFLDTEGQVHYPESFVPFGMGPRNCLGETLAKMELFMFFTILLQAFTLTIPADTPIPSLEPQMGINMSPYPYQLCATHR